MSKEVMFERLSKFTEIVKESSGAIGEDMSDIQKAIVMATMIVAAIYTIYLASRSLEGTVNRWWEKALTVSGAIGVIALNGLVNYEIWK